MIMQVFFVFFAKIKKLHDIDEKFMIIMGAIFGQT